MAVSTAQDFTVKYTYFEIAVVEVRARGGLKGLGVALPRTPENAPKTRRLAPSPQKRALPLLSLACRSRGRL